jgi:hypothetical protein
MRLRILAALVFFAPAAFAVSPQFWRVTSADEFLAGESTGIAITSKGELKVAPATTKTAAVSDPFVLSQARDDRGTLYVGTGNDGKVYRLEGSSMKEVFKAAEPEIYALAWHRGALLVASSPNGNIYRIDPRTNAASTFATLDAPYVWSMVSDGDSLLVATGTDAKLYRIDASGKSSVIYDAPELHLRSLALLPDGRIWAGGSGEGRIYEIAKNGSGRALYDSSLTEISALHFDRSTGFGWATAAASALPSSAPPRANPNPPAQQNAAGAATSAGDQAQTASQNVDVSFSFESSSANVPSGVSELYRIHPDGYVEVMRKFDREIAYALADGGNGSVLIGTGPNGRIYRLNGGDIELLSNVPEKQVVSIERSGSDVFVTTTNAGAVYRIGTTLSTTNEFKTAVKDLDRFSRFGEYRLEGRGLEGVKVGVRSGNTNAPDETWSTWREGHGESGSLDIPAARYAQFRVELPANAVVDTMSLAYVNRNVAPIIDSVQVFEPGVIFVSNAFPASPVVVEATNPDENGIFTSLENPRDRNDPGKRLFRKGYRTIQWKVRDENNDQTRSSLFFRRAGTTAWLKMRENMEETSFNFDSSQLPDGEYEVRVVASDAPDNPANALEGSREDASFDVDNAAPAITSSATRKVEIEDQRSPLVRVEYSVDAEKWVRLLPDDAILDSRRETFTLPSDASNGRFVTVRAVDSHFNVITQSVPSR